MADDRVDDAWARMETARFRPAATPRPNEVGDHLDTDLDADIAASRAAHQRHVLAGLRRDNEAARLWGHRAAITVDDVDFLLNLADQAPVADDLTRYANPDCSCGGTGYVAGQPCPTCIVAVWS